MLNNYLRLKNPLLNTTLSLLSSVSVERLFSYGGSVLTFQKKSS